MKVTAHIQGLDDRMLGNKLFEQLDSFIPEAMVRLPGGAILNAELSLEDPRYQRLRELLAGAGFKPREPFQKAGPKDYLLRLRRKYEIEDYATCSWLVPAPRFFLPEMTVAPDGGLGIDASATRKRAVLTKEILGCAGSRELLVSTPLRNKIEAARLAHVVFQPVELMEDGDVVPWPDDSPLWEVTSDLILPPLDRLNLRTQKGEPYTGDPGKGCFPTDGFYQPAELRYRASGCAAVPPFGLALTLEGLGAGKGQRSIIASQDFLRFCSELALEVDWIPVRIE